MWWEFHRLLDLTPEQLVDEDDPIGLLEPIGPVGEAKNGKQTWRYAFPAQDYDLGRGEVYDPANKQARPNDSPFSWTVGRRRRRSTRPNRTVDLRRTVGEPHPRAIVPLDWVRTKDHQAVAVRARRMGRRPRHRGDRPEPGRPRPAVRAAAAGRAVAGRGPSAERASRTSTRRGGSRWRSITRTLSIQGPPGSGKTYSGARMVRTLLNAGKRVGITGTSHKVIGNLLTAVLAASAPGDVDAVPVQHAKPEQMLADDPRVTRAKDAADVRARLDDGRANLAAGTSWLWASSKMIEAVDVLFVDEAGQISLANVIAIARATDSLVLLGDPQQLDQPLQGSHPPGADRSALAHVLGRDATMPPTRGLFLETTWRLHPDLCAFTSEVFYDGPPRARGRMLATSAWRPAATSPTGPGPRQLDVPTVGADNESPDEADAVAALARSIVDGRRELGRPGRRDASGRLGRHPDRRAVQRPGRRRSSAGCRPRPASGPSTSSRARRRRSASTR